MHEYEFRLVMQDSSSFLPYLQSLGYPIQKQVIYYAKPHFRYKNGTMEVKRIESIQAVYHDNMWFKWVHSIETPYKYWNSNTCKTFLHNVGNYQDPFTVEIRDFIQIDSQTQLYTFRSGHDYYKLVFEWEYGTFKNELTNFNGRQALQCLSKYKSIYKVFRYCNSPYKLNENIKRKPVKCITPKMENVTNYLFAHKLDGTFGFIYSYENRIKEKWEGYECIVRHNVTLGNGFVFAAEKMENGDIFLLDVYQFQGYDTASWCRREILLNFLPQLNLIEGYFIQRYMLDQNLPPTSLKTDGIIIHDVEQDVIFKCKTNHSIDLVYFNGYFHLPNGRIKCIENVKLENGSVYEISTNDGQVVRKRCDRFRGNNTTQIKNVLEYGWHGPPIEYNLKTS